MDLVDNQKDLWTHPERYVLVSLPAELGPDAFMIVSSATYALVGGPTDGPDGAFDLHELRRRMLAAGVVTISHKEYERRRSPG
jgi:hypothetical protein